MLSILIPTYNYNCYKLVAELRQQACLLNIIFEILVADDASKEESKIENREINALPFCKFIELRQNIGRARIRNFLGETALYDYLLFMDCDGEVNKSDFLKCYLEARTKADIILGGLSNPDKLPAPNLSLRYTYESMTLKNRANEDRNKNPYAQFTTFCFLIKRSTFLSTKFDESFTEYGYEDVVFGRELQKKNTSILYIDNPLCHMGLDDNEVYLRKVHTGIKNLLEKREKLESNTTLLIYYNKLKKIKLTPLFFLFFHLFRKQLKNNLLSPRPNMRIFALYKLGYLCQLDRKNSKK